MRRGLPLFRFLIAPQLARISQDAFGHVTRFGKKRNHRLLVIL